MVRVRMGCFLLAVTLLVATRAPAQNDAAPQPQSQTKSQASDPQKPEASKKSTAGRKPAVLELAPVSTSAAAQSAAREISKRQSESLAKSTDPKSKTDEPQLGTPDSSAVDEFKPASPADDAVVTTSKESKKSAAKNIHGTASGSLDPTARGNHQAAGSVGATSKSGKTSVYVETDSSRATSPPH